MKTPQQLGREFEEEFAQDLGLSVVPGSGSQWWSKLDVQGKGARWSLKSTTKTSFTVDEELIAEGVKGCDDGSIPLWAFRIEGLPDLVMMFKDDFISLQKNEIQLTTTENTQREQRKERARTPQLLREESSG